MAASVAPLTADGERTYTYSSQPRTVQQRSKFRDQGEYSNIMHDRRVVRGNTYGLQTLPASSQPDPLELQRQQESRRRALARKRAREHLRPRSPEPVEGRKHVEVQTELYLEEITDRIEEADIQTQTDAFLDRPPTPLFIPAKTGLDVATQIEQGDLFDFDLEVKPILEVLIGKTVEQSLLEVMEEEELASLRAQQRLFEENRNAEVVETQRLEEQERRHREEKERRMQQQRKALLKEKETAEKIAARAFAQSYLADLIPSVFSTLNEHGFFYDPIEREIETRFIPWLVDEAEKALEQKVLARALVDVILRDIVSKQLGISVSDQTTPTPQKLESPTTVALATNEEDGSQVSNGQLSKVFGKDDGMQATSNQPQDEKLKVDGANLLTDQPQDEKLKVNGENLPEDQPQDEKLKVDGENLPEDQPQDEKLKVDGENLPEDQPQDEKLKVDGENLPDDQPQDEKLKVDGDSLPNDQPQGDTVVPIVQESVGESPTDLPPTVEPPSIDQDPPTDQPGDHESTKSDAPQETGTSNGVDSSEQQEEQS